MNKEEFEKYCEKITKESSVDTETLERYKQQYRECCYYQLSYDEWKYFKEYLELETCSDNLISHPFLKQKAKALNLDIFEKDGKEYIRTPEIYGIKMYPKMLNYYTRLEYLKQFKDEHKKKINMKPENIFGEIPTFKEMKFFTIFGIITSLLFIFSSLFLEGTNRILFFIASCTIFIVVLVVLANYNILLYINQKFSESEKSQ